MKQKIVLILLVVLIFSCTSQKTVRKQIPYPPIPKIEKRNIIIPIATHNKNINLNDIVHNKNFVILPGKKVVISSPTDTIQGAYGRKTDNIKNFKDIEQKSKEMIDSKKSNDVDLYSTSGYYNFVEEQIEKSLIKCGFNVIDRSKFEAKYSGNKRLKHISDVIRAAQEGEIRSDYVLQINVLKIGIVKKHINIIDNSEIYSLLIDDPSLKEQILEFQSIPIVSVQFNAKLIDVPTGQIVWLGNHTLSSDELIDNDFDLKMNIKIKKYRHPSYDPKSS